MVNLLGGIRCLKRYDVIMNEDKGISDKEAR